ncbi:PhzF family phenazine biosynthesis protein [Marinicauda algicola]|uniref:PhzF family phenazine biosynthesis protein n=1 Tax=Marinicauda algicola TaxID=2029849 RepID=A0A4S2H073_9PROT|nr:PhzF family phenazine biosynthesis protein [Marinicauda algicola]TGY88940.1 PhzF family phenazine biosynthesis protein [Marinicauda algicola]
MSDTRARLPVQRLAAFSSGARGGNPAGVVLAGALPEDATMQAIAAEVGFSETVFAAPRGPAIGDGLRVRYFSPEAEIPFCGHATIALGAALAKTHGSHVFALKLNAAEITVEGRADGGDLFAALQSPPTSSRPAGADLAAGALALFGLTQGDLDPRLPPALVEAGATHLLLALKTREALAAMDYDLAAGKALMRAAGLVTLALVHAETGRLFHARNAFASSGVFEDPATGAAAAALAGYLRDLAWPQGGTIEIRQGEDMGTPCLITAEIRPERGGPVRVSGTVREMG